MKKLLILLMFFCVAGMSSAAITKSSAEVDVWAEVAENALREGATTSVSDAYRATVTVSVASTHADAGEGMYIIVQTSATSSGDDDWTTVSGGKVLALVGTANLETITNNPATAGTTVFTVASTAGYTTDGIQYVFIEDAADVTDSEIMQVVSSITDTSITVQDGSTTEHANTAVLSNLAEKYTFSIPMTANRVRVLYDNTFDSDGTAPTVHTHATVDKVTGI